MIQSIETHRTRIPMNSDLRHFIGKYLSIVFGTLLSVSFVAFVSIPYSLGAHPGEDAVAITPAVNVPVGTPATQG
jgi:hypothetical protein